MMRPRKPAGRRGVAIVPVLVCFVLILLMMTVVLKLGQARRAQTLGEERRLQAEWLAETGLERARAKLAASRDYTGETWEVKAEDLDARAPGVVTIRVEKDQEKPTQRRVSVRADYPRDADHRARQRKEVLWDLGPEKGGEKS